MRRTLVVLLVVATFGLWAQGAVPCSVVEAQPACRAEFLPGPALDALDVVELGDDVQDYTSNGELVFTTVRVDTNLTFGEWLRGLTDPTVDLVDRDLVIPPGEDADDVADRNAARMDESQSVAALAALRHLGFEAPAPQGAEIVGLVAPSLRSFEEGQLQLGDVVVAVDGQPVTTAEEGTELVGRLAPGDEVTLTVLRPVRDEDGDPVRTGPLDDAERLEVTLTLKANPEDASRPLVGVSLATRVRLPVDVGIDAGNIGGPSAGLMFALAIVDRLTPTDLTGGGVVAGTGTITVDGTVGAIGGIRQKVVGAIDRENGGTAATVFLTPASQLEEARQAAVDDEILLVPVATLDEAVAALEDLAAGATPSGALAIGVD